ncbi:MAG: hypothetical protein ACKPEY_12420 [Planctomycetota bacterium]
MRRRFRWWRKKRGKRRTGSPLLGSLSEAMFYGVLLILGTLSLTFFLLAAIFGYPLSVLQSGFGFWLLVLVEVSFVLIGGGGLIYTILRVGTSVERRSSLARRAANLELISEAIVTPRDYPTLPSDANLTNSPGIKLAYRLPTEQSPLWHFTAAAVFGVLWNGLSIGLLLLAINRHLQQRPDWLLTFMCVPLAIVAFWSVRYLYQQIVLLTVVGPTIVEIGEHPLRPGQYCPLFLSQGGQDTFESLRLALVCEEEATFRQGTDVRVEHCRLADIPICSQAMIKVESGKPYEHDDDFCVPRYAMHSFQSPHNRVLWYLEVIGKPAGRAEFIRRFPLVVYPLQTTEPPRRGQLTDGQLSQQASAT